LGHDTKSIATSNLASVALAAIQGLHRVVEERNATIERQHGEISALRDDLQALRVEVSKLKQATLHDN
jgi:phage shock protein A